MAVKIGSARSDERGKITGGQPGDQRSGKEVSTQDWYLHKKGWVIIRLKDPAKRERAAYAMQEACDNKHFGYAQDTRMTGYNAAAKVGFDPAKVTVNVNIDCSELVRLCLAYAGISVPNWYTGNMVDICRSRKDDFEIIEGTKAETSDYLVRGDILVTKTKGHTVIVLSDGAKIKKPTPITYPDISHHHPVTDWEAFAKSARFAVHKATQRTDFIDPCLLTFIKECEKRKIPYWLYTYLEKGDELAQTKFLVKTCKDQVGKFFVGYILDVEAGNFAVDVKIAHDWLKKQSGKTMIYTGYSDSRIYKAVIDGRGDNCAWWEARYGKNTGIYSEAYPCHDGVDLHQFTSQGECPGIKDRIDLNRLTGTRPLEWFTDPAVKAEIPKKKSYSGTYPSLANGRKDSSGYGYYKLGDGISTLKNYPTQIKRVQLLLNWINDGGIAIDGQYGKQTRNACDAAQRKLGLTVSGIFDYALLNKAKNHKK